MTEVIEAPAAVKPVHHWIGGRSVPVQSGRSGPIYNPATGEQTGEVDFASVEEIDAAVVAAKNAYESWRITPGPPLPAFLEPLRARCAAFLAVAPTALAETLVTEYPPGAGIGWHRDAPQFGPVVGVSLLSACRMRFRSGTGTARQVRTLVLEPRSAYVLDGDVRWRWQHHIPPIPASRYSVTFRTLRAPDTPGVQ